MDKDCNFLLRCFCELKDPVDLSLLYFRLGSNADNLDNEHAALAELRRLGVFHMGRNSNGEETYLIKEPIRKELLQLPENRQENMYDYLLGKEQIALQEDRDSKWYTTANAKLQYLDYPNTKNKAKWSFWVSVATFFIAVVALIVSIVKKG